MIENFVDFETSKKLKEKGFPQTPDYFNYSSYYEWDGLRKIHSLSNASVWFDPNFNKENLYFAPTISQAIDWIRIEKKYHIEFVGNACGYLFIVSDIPELGGTDRYCSDYSGPNDGGTWDTYEDCAKAAIDYVINNMI